MNRWCEGAAELTEVVTVVYLLRLESADILASQYIITMILYEKSICIKSYLSGQNGRHFADDIFRCILVNEKFYILIRVLLKFLPKGPNDNNPALVKIMAWRREGHKPLSEPMLT